MIEDHFEIQNLKKIIDRKQDERDKEKHREAMNKELDVNEDIPARIFFCSNCQKDYTPRVVFKIEEDDWNTSGKFRYWKAKCSCGRFNKRLITQKIKDPFWSQSASVRRDRSQNYKDIIQPEERGFSMLYGRKHNETTQ